MEQIGTNQFKSGMTLALEGEIYLLVSFEHVKPGKGGAFVRTKLKSLKTGNVISRTFRGEERLTQAFLEEKKMQFLYRQGNLYHFMDQESFEEMELSLEQLADKTKFLKENVVISIVVSEGSIIGINLPNFVELKVVQAEPGVRADTVKTVTKIVTLETGAQIAVPLFINNGDVIKIDSRTGEYVSRV